MDGIYTRVANLLKQEYPTMFKDFESTIDVLLTCAYIVMGYKNLSLYAKEELIPYKYGTVGYVEMASELGYSAIVNDGKLLGFRKEKNAL